MITQKATFTSDVTIYGDQKGRIVSKDDPNVTRVLLQAGDEISIERAQQLGLVDSEGNAKQPEQKAKKSATEDKAMKQPSVSGTEDKAVKQPQVSPVETK